MQRNVYDSVKETLYYEKLANGLDVYMLPKPGFQKTYATFATRYGSIDNHFQVEGGKEVRVPDGIAHFLEHKMFEEPEGDIFSTFASQGASANAFTSFDRTVYLFSATERIAENLTTLVNFVQNPYFTDANVEKEKGIIAQEIKMYQDHPDWRCYYGLIEAMYREHPVRIDIAGTVSSISQITKETLYECYRTFYHPGNMMLFVVGGVDPEEVFALIRENQEGKHFENQGAVRRFYPQEPPGVAMKKKVVHLPVSLPKCLFGFKETVNGLEGRELLELELGTKLMLEILYGQSSDYYQSLYDEHLISDQFGYDFQCSRDYAFSMIGGETRDPELLLSRVEAQFNEALEKGIGEADFERCKRKRIGAFLRMLNSPEAIANQFSNYQFKGCNLFDILPVYESLTLDRINSRLREHVKWEQFAVSIVTGDSV